MNNITYHSPNAELLPEVRKSSNINISSIEESLLRNIHSGNQIIYIEKEFRGNYGGAHVFLILPVNADGSRDARLITKIGSAAELIHEKENYSQHVAFALPFSAAHVQGYYEENGQAALNYDFAGERILGETVTLAEYYRVHTDQEIKATLEALLDKSLRAWYGQSHPLNCTFRDEYGERLPADQEMPIIISTIFPDLTSFIGDRIEIPGVDGSYPNPLKVYLPLLDRILEGRKSYVHGDLHMRNVLVDQTGKSWLIDFANVDRHHTMLDFIKLETYIRLMVIAPHHRTFSLNEYMLFERTLTNDTVNQNVSYLGNPHLAKAYAVILFIRHIARKYMGTEQDLRNEYFPALFLYCLARLKHHESNGLAPTQLIFMTSCALAANIFDKPDDVNPVSPKGNQKSKEEQRSVKDKKTTRSHGGISIGGNANGSIIVSGNQNKINQRTQYVTPNSSPSIDEIARAFSAILEQASKERDGAKKERAERLVRKLESEARKGEEADDYNVEDWFAALATTSSQTWQVAVTTLSNPIVGIGTIFQQAVQRARNEQEK